MNRPIVLSLLMVSTFVLLASASDAALADRYGIDEGRYDDVDDTACLESAACRKQLMEIEARYEKPKAAGLLGLAEQVFGLLSAAVVVVLIAWLVRRAWTG
jgi:hypothetical protein